MQAGAAETTAAATAAVAKAVAAAAAPPATPAEHVPPAGTMNVTCTRTCSPLRTLRPKPKRTLLLLLFGTNELSLFYKLPAGVLLCCCSGESGFGGGSSPASTLGSRGSRVCVWDRTAGGGTGSRAPRTSVRSRVEFRSYTVDTVVCARLWCTVRDRTYTM
jgi:hypothetical protein